MVAHSWLAAHNLLIFLGYCCRMVCYLLEAWQVVFYLVCSNLAFKVGLFCYHNLVWGFNKFTLDSFYMSLLLSLDSQNFSLDSFRYCYKSPFCFLGLHLGLYKSHYRLPCYCTANQSPAYWVHFDSCLKIKNYLQSIFFAEEFPWLIPAL